MTFFPIDPNTTATAGSLDSLFAGVNSFSQLSPLGVGDNFIADNFGSLFGAVNTVGQGIPLGVGDSANTDFFNSINSLIAPVTGINTLDGIFDTTGFTGINDFATAFAGVGSSGNFAADQVNGLISGILNNGANPALGGLAQSFITQDLFAIESGSRDAFNSGFGFA